MDQFGLQPFQAVTEKNLQKDPTAFDQQQENSIMNAESFPVRQNLMSLLSGKQKSKKHNKLKKVKQETETETDTEVDVDTIMNPEILSSDVPMNLKEMNDVEELEKKIFSSSTHQSISAKDFLISKKVPKKSSEILANEATNSAVELVEDVDTDVIEVESDQEISNKELELKMFSGANVKRTTAKELFGALRYPKKSGDAVPLSSSRNPESGRLFSPMSLLQGMQGKKKLKEQHMVKLRIRTDALKDIQRSVEDPFFTKGLASSIRNPKHLSSGANVKSVFQSMMAHSVANSPKLTALQKLKTLEPPVLDRSQFFVVPSETTTTHSTVGSLTSLNHKEKAPIKVHDADSEFYEFSAHRSDDIHEVNFTYSEGKALELEQVLERIPKLLETPMLKRVYDTFISSKTDISTSYTRTSQLWTEYFRPTETSHLMLHPDTALKLKNWIINAFNRLKTQTLATPRNVQLKKQKRLQQLRGLGSMDNFVVPDDEETEEETEEEVFVPVLIIRGSAGMGKSASVYAALEEIRGYVYEVNSGQSRSRRDLYSTLKEFCTTQLVHLNHRNDTKSSKEFQKGIILFEDTDILFEQDRTFWTVVQDMINISRRPIIITCSDTANIPKGIIDHAREDSAILDIDCEVNNETKSQLMSYLWLCSYSQGFDLPKDVLNSIVKSPSGIKGYDLRRCLMELQIICNFRNPGLLITSISLIRNETEPAKQLKYYNNDEQDIESLSQKLDLLSSSDVISSSSTSQIKSHLQENEILDFYIIDESKLLRQRTLPFELNIGSLLGDSIQKEGQRYNTACNESQSLKETFNHIRNSVTTFTGSRSKKLPKFLLGSDFAYTRRSTRSLNNGSFEDGNSSGNGTPVPFGEGASITEWRPDTVGIPDGSICKYLSVTPYLLELAPFNRNWATFQASLDIKEIETLAQHNVSVKKFIAWRQFQSDPSIVINTLHIAL